MTKAEEMAKDFQERDLQRQGAVALWGRTWKADLVSSLKTEHDLLSSIHAQHLRKFPTLETEPTSDEERAARIAKMAWEILRDTREQMLALALHPTRPKSQHPSYGGGRPRKNSDPVIDAEPVHQTPTETP